MIKSTESSIKTLENVLDVPRVEKILPYCEKQSVAQCRASMNYDYSYVIAEK